MLKVLQKITQATSAKSSVNILQNTCCINILQNRLYSFDYNNLPTTCPGANFKKTGDEVSLKEDSEYPEWLWTLGGPKKDIKDMSPEVEGKAYYKRLKKMKLRENNMIRKNKKF